MYRKALILLWVSLVTGMLHAGPSESVAAYFTNVVKVASTCTNAGDTGLSVSNAYLCFDVNELGDLTEAQSTGSVAAVMVELVGYLYDRIQSMASSNQPVYLTVTEQVEYNTAGTTQTVFHAIATKRTATSTYGYPSE